MTGPPCYDYRTKSNIYFLIPLHMVKRPVLSAFVLDMVGSRLTQSSEGGNR